MAMKQLSKAIGLLAMATSGTALAATPTLKEVLDASGVTVSGYVDAAYTYYNTDTPTLLNYFDDTESSFGVKQAALTVSSLPKEGFGALVNITAGSDADWIHSNGGTNSGGFDLTQAYVQYATGPFTIMGGKFNTLAGAEVIAPTGNTNISRSIAFLWALPFTHTGVRLAVAPADGLTLYAGLNNGWDQQDDLNDDKTVELGAIWSPVSSFTWAASIYNGKDPSDPADLTSEATDRFLFDTVLTFKVTDALTLILNYDLGSQEDGTVDGSGDLDDAEWSSIIGYVNYQFNDQWRVSLRGEQYDDKDGNRIQFDGPDGEKITSYTVTVGYAPTSNFELRGEVRMDNTDDEVLLDDGEPDDSQTYAAVEALYKF